MRSHTLRRLAPIALILAGAAAISIGGPLDPPAGPVTSTYKTLSEVQPRIAINAANTPGDAGNLFRITQPGSYYLTGNITGVAAKHGISINASNVTIDLMGFTVQGAAGAPSGITTTTTPLNNLCIRNGFVSGGTRRNLDWVRPHLSCGPDVSEDDLLLLADAQTSGGLLVVGELRGHPVIGHTVAGSGIEVR